MQIRLEGQISKSPEIFSDQHFYGREQGKNIAAIVSNQSQPIESYEMLQAKFEQTKSLIESGELEEKRPQDWGCYQIKMSYFEFWEASEERLNYRECYKLSGNDWEKFFLQS